MCENFTKNTGNSFVWQKSFFSDHSPSHKICTQLLFSLYLCIMSSVKPNLSFTEPWGIMAAFAVLIGPFALDFHMHYPDEMYYTDAAVKMLQNGDYLTTYLGSDELRFKKPIGTYWAVLLGFKLFGVNAFGARIFFLLAGASTIGLTYWLSKTLFEDKKIASLAALVMASNPVLIFSATRSIPDVLLVMTMTASAIGFAGLLQFGNQAPSRFLWILYLSLGLAFEIKGLPAIALGGLGFIYLLANPWKRVTLNKLVHLPSIFLSLGIGLFWFVAMYFLHGPTYLDSFLEDQVGIRVASKFWLVIQNGLLALTLLFVIFLPWMIFGLPKINQNIRKIWKENSSFFGFAIVWGLGILAMGAMTSKFYERYLLPVAPVLAVWISWLLIRSNFESKLKTQKIVLLIFLFLNLLIFMISTWLNFQMKANPLIWLQLFIGASLMVYLIESFLKNKNLVKTIALSIPLLFFLASTATYQISLPEQGKQVALFFSTQKIESSQKIGFVGNLHVSSKIRIALGPNYQMIDLPSDSWKNKIQFYSNLIVEDKLLSQLDTTQFKIRMVSANWDSKSIPKLIRNAGDPDFDSLLKINSKKYFLVSKKEPNNQLLILSPQNQKLLYTTPF